MRKRIIILAALAAGLGLAAGAMPAASAATSTGSRSAGQSTAVDFTSIPGGPKDVGIQVKTNAVVGTQCGKTLADSSKYAAKGITTVGCLERATVPVSGQVPKISASAAGGNTVWCQSDPTNEWWVTRTTGCVYNEQVNYTQYNTQTGAESGSATIMFSDSIVLNTSSSQFTETNYVTMVNEDNVPELLVTYSGGCNSLCVVLDPTAEDNAVLTLGSTVSGNTTYSDAPFAQSLDVTDLAATLSITPPGGNLVSPATINDPASIRCDNGLAVSTTTGCIYPQVTPTVGFSLSSTGSTAVIDGWAMINEQAHWGYYGNGQPLTRITNSATGDSNRAAICGNFVSLYTNDSCEEFPFASTYQSYGYGKKCSKDGTCPGDSCAQVRAVNTNGQWSINYLGTVTLAEPCVRGHADITSQNRQGGTLSSFYQQNRVMDADPYWVSISS